MLQLELDANQRRTLAAGDTATSRAYDVYLQARGHLQRRNAGDIDEAIDLFHQAQTLDPNYALAYAGLGEAYWRKYRDTRDTRWVTPARENCQRALSLNSQLAPVYIALGIVEEGSGRHTEALAALEKARALEPSNPTVSSELGAVYESTGDFPRAESSYQAATDLRRDDWTSLNVLGGFYYRRGRYADAIPLFQKVTQLAPANSQGFTNLGATYAMLGQYDNAAASFQQSLRLPRPTAFAYSNLGTIYYFQGRCADAVPMMQRASELSAASEIVWGNLGDAYACTGANDAARQAYRRALDLGRSRLAVNPSDADTWSLVGLYQAKLGDAASALASIKKAESLTHHSLKVDWAAALVYEISGQRNRALSSLKVAIDEGEPPNEIRGEPALANLRKDPRFEALLTTKSK